MHTSYTLSITTQGPLYPPSEILDEHGDFVTIGRINRLNPETGTLEQLWGSAIISKTTQLPQFGENSPHTILKNLDLNSAEDRDIILYTLPYPIPCHNYPMVFAPEQLKKQDSPRKSYPLHLAPIPDERSFDGRRTIEPITLGQWIQAEGVLNIEITKDKKFAIFGFEFNGLIPSSLYTVMALREHDLDPNAPTRPGPLGIPNVFITDERGAGKYEAIMPNPFPSRDIPLVKRNRIINVVLLWMSSQMSHGGAIGYYGLGVDIHAQLKFPGPMFLDLETTA